MSKEAFYGWKLLVAFWVTLFINLACPAYSSSVINAFAVAGTAILCFAGALVLFFVRPLRRTPPSNLDGQMPAEPALQET